MARERATRLTAIAASFRRLFKIASVNPVLWWSPESHRAALAGGAATLFQDSGGTSPVTAVEQPAGLVRSTAGNGPRRNLLAYSEQFDNAVWTKQSGVTVTANQTTAPDGSGTADQLTHPSALGYLWAQADSLPGTNTLSIYAKAGASRYLGVDIWSAMIDTGGVFDLLTGTYVGAGGLRAIESQRITVVGNGWYRIGLTDSRFGAGNIRVGFAASTASGALNSLAGNSVYLWGAQLERGSTATAYQRVASGLEYIDALQSTSPARPILTARKNLLTWSEQFDKYGGWDVAGVTCAANQSTAPDGTLSADRITGSSGLNAVIFPSNGIAMAAGNAAASIHLKAGTAAYAVVSIWVGGGTAGANVWVNLATGAVASSSATAGYTVVSATSVDLGGGWFRILLAATAPAATLFLSVRIVDGNGAFSYTNTVGKTLDIWGAQLEYGSTATSYQRITSATDYDITAAPLLLSFDGVDDSLSSATFPAGTLPANADVYMVVRRGVDDAMLFLSSTTSSTRFLFCMSTGTESSYSDAGTPTHFVNGSQVAGGISTSRSQLLAAVPLGVTTLVEARNANLSTWDRMHLSAYAGGFSVTAAVGDVLITPAQSDATRAKIRKALAKTYKIEGVV